MVRNRVCYSCCWTTSVNVILVVTSCSVRANCSSLLGCWYLSLGAFITSELGALAMLIGLEMVARWRRFAACNSLRSCAVIMRWRFRHGCGWFGHFLLCFLNVMKCSCAMVFCALFVLHLGVLRAIQNKKGCGFEHPGRMVVRCRSVNGGSNALEACCRGWTRSICWVSRTPWTRLNQPSALITADDL